MGWLSETSHPNHFTRSQCANRVSIAAGARPEVCLSPLDQSSEGIVYPDGSNPPGTSGLSFTEGQTISNLSVDQVGPDGRVRVLNGSAGQINVIADVAGCYLDERLPAKHQGGALSDHDAYIVDVDPGTPLSE